MPIIDIFKHSLLKAFQHGKTIHFCSKPETVKNAFQRVFTPLTFKNVILQPAFKMYSIETVSLAYTKFPIISRWNYVFRNVYKYKQ